MLKNAMNSTTVFPIVVSLVIPNFLIDSRLGCLCSKYRTSQEHMISSVEVYCSSSNVETFCSIDFSK